jgi:beta-glucuronidase
MLYPVENEIRQVKVLNGIWKFKKESRQGQGVQEKWYEKPLTDYIEMPVPSSYNDITTDKEIRDHVGWVWYEREFFIPTDWQDKRMVLRFGSVTHHAIVYINGKEYPLRGRICMDQCMIEIGDDESVKRWDKVIIFSEKINGVKQSAQEIADKAETISYEVTSCITKRIKRIFID